MKITIVSIIVCMAVACLPKSGLGWEYGGGAQPSNPGFPLQPEFPIDPQPPTDSIWTDPPFNPVQPAIEPFPVDPIWTDPPFIPGQPIIQPFPVDPCTKPPRKGPIPGRPGRPGRRQAKTRRPKKPKRERRRQRGNKCQRLANRGSCRFYNCFKNIEPTCLNQGDFIIDDLETFCKNTKPLIKRGKFTAQGKKYINRVRKCQNKLLLNFVSNQNCDVINNQANLALLGTESGDVNSRDCYWQNEEFCDIICNVKDNSALVQAVFGDDDGGFDEQQIALGEHLQYLSSFCSQFAENIFQENFVNQCPPGTLDRATPTTPPPTTPPTTTPPMMMMGGGGAD